MPLQLQYLIKWEGYAEADNTWEPAENLECDELVKEFEKNRKLKEKGRSTDRKDREKDRSKDRAVEKSGDKERKKRDSVPNDEHDASVSNRIMCTVILLEKEKCLVFKQSVHWQTTVGR